jgi:hypothetical protein
MDGDSFAGTWHQGGKDFLLVLHKLEKAEVPNSPQEPQPPAPHDTLQAAYPNPNAGTSTMGNAQVPAAKSNISTTVAIDQEVYPAVLKVMADMFLQRGIKAGTVRWELRNDGDEAVRVALTSQITEWTAPAVDQVDLEPHSTTSVDQSPFGTKLLTVQSAISLPVLLQAKVGDEVVFEETRSIKVNAADDWIFSKDKPYDVAPLIAAWVTPKDPSVEWVLSKAKEKRFGRSLGGYQEDVTGQIKAIFNEVRDLGVSYVSSTIDFARLGQSQRVRLPKEVIAQKSANCIDGAVLFASLFENIGLEPLIVLVPGHAFVGVRLAPGSSNVQFIETTMVGRSGLESVLTGERTYKAAMREGDEEFATARIAAQTNPNSVYLVDIKTARDAGIYPTW